MDASKVYSPLDIWEENIRGNPGFKGNPPSNFTGPRDASGAPMSNEEAQRPASGTGWSPMVRRPQPASIRRKEDIPAGAGAGLGNWNQRWNPVTNRWEDDPELQ